VRTKFIASLVLACATAATAAAPMLAQAQEHRRHRVEVCSTSKGHRNTGTVIGAVAGGLAGNALASGGGKTGGTLIGAGVGAVAGHEIAKHNGKKHCHYEWR